MLDTSFFLISIISAKILVLTQPLVKEQGIVKPLG